MNNKFFLKNILLYLCWTILFTIILIIVVRPEKLFFGIIVIAFVISSILSIPSTFYFFKILKRPAIKNEDLFCDFFPNEKLVLKADASLKKSFGLLGGILFLTDKHILFIGNEFFDRNKKLIHVPLNAIEKYEQDDNQLKIRDNSNKEYTLLLNETTIFFTELKKILT